MQFKVYLSDKKFPGLCGRSKCQSSANYMLIITRFRDNHEYEELKTKYLIQSFSGYYSGTSFILEFELSLCESCYQKFLKEIDLFDMI